MAATQWGSFSGAAELVGASLYFDDVTLQVLYVQYWNYTARDAAAVINDNGTIRTVTLSAHTPASGTGTQQSNLRNTGYVMTHLAPVVHNGTTYDVYDLPAGVSVSWRYPA